MITNEQLIRNILNDGNFSPASETIHGWIAVIDDMVFRTQLGRFIFNSREQAVKALYNSLVWVVARHYSYFMDNGTSIPHPTWRDSGSYWDRRKTAWKDFKEYLGDRIRFIEI